MPKQAKKKPARKTAAGPSPEKSGKAEGAASRVKAKAPSGDPDKAREREAQSQGRRSSRLEGKRGATPPAHEPWRRGVSKTKGKDGELLDDVAETDYIEVYFEDEGGTPGLYDLALFRATALHPFHPSLDTGLSVEATYHGASNEELDKELSEAFDRRHGIC